MTSSWDVMESIRCEIEDYGDQRYEEGYAEGQDEYEMNERTLEEIRQEAVLEFQGYVKREHSYQGKTVITWVEGPGMVLK